MKSIAQILSMLAFPAAGLLFTSMATAGGIPYGSPGVQNPATYNFTADSTGDIIGYFAGSTAGYTEVVGMSVNGGSVSAWGLNNHSTSVGTSFDFGSVNAGDVIRFYVDVITSGYIFSSDKTQNPDGVNHVYSTTAVAGQAFSGSLAGTYVAFEDLFGGGDLNYHDNTFVFTNVSNGVDNVPDSGTTSALVGSTILCLWGLRRRIRNA